MVDVVTLSSDSEDELVDFKKTPKKLKRLSKGSKSSSPKKSINIEGVPKSFSSDSKTRFSFGVCGDDSFLDIPTTSKWNFSPNKSDKNEENIRESDSPDLFAKPPLDYKSPNKKISPLANPPMPKNRKRSFSAILPSEAEKSSKSGKNLTKSSEKIDEFALTSSDDEKKDDLALRALISPNKKRTKRGEKKNLIQNEFFGVYCLISRSPRPCFKNRCYIGYTVDPNRRIMQHNGGREKGGAKKTDNRGPWDMVCVVHGFPNSVAALRFEWAWQNPNVSKVIRHHELKKGRKETPFAFQLRIACCLINSKPFSRFALTFRWLELKEEIPFPEENKPPPHVGTSYGKVEKQFSLVPEDSEGYEEAGECRLCGKEFARLWHLVRCVASPNCNAHFHTKCLAAEGLRKLGEFPKQLFPLKGKCPVCNGNYLWGDVIKEQRRIILVSAKATDEFKKMVVKKNLVVD